MLPAFDIRLIGYTPGGTRFTEGQAVIPATNIDFVAPLGDTPTLRFNVSDVAYTTLPEYFEVAVEYWTGTAWVEGENSRFLVNGENDDDTDPAKMRSLTGVNLWEWFANKANLAGAAPYAITGLNAEAAKTLTTVTSSGTTLTKTAHGLANGDQVRLTVVGATKPTGLTVGTVYWVRDVTTNTFKLAGSSDGSAKTIGTASGMTFVRLRTRLLATNTTLVNNDKVVISAIGGSDATFTVGDSFYVVRRTSSKFELSKSVGGDSIEIGTAGPISLYRDTDGNRQFSAVNPGTMMKTAIDEAKTRGWGTFLTYDFSNTTTSAGVAWPDLTTQQLKPGTTIAQMLQLLREQGWVDTATQGRTLRMFAPERGVDRTTGSAPTRVGRNATTIPIRRSIDNLVTDLTVRGEGTIQLTLNNPAAPAELGRLEAYETLSGVLDNATATILGNETLDKGEDPQRQYTVTEPAASAANLPFLDYQVGDWVQAWINNTWQRFRVAEFVIGKDASGVVTVSTVLNDRFTELLARLARKRVAAVGGTISGGSGGGVDETDTRKPKAPVGLVTDTVGSWAADGNAVASVFATWTAVTEATDSTSIDVDVYELWLRPDGSNTSNLATSTEDTTVGFGPLIAGRTYYAKVRARTRAGQYGEYTAEVEFTAAQPLEIIGKPDAPTVTSEKRTVTVKWNGLIEGATFPAHLRHVYVAQSDASGGTYTPVGQVIRVAGGQSVISSGLPAIGATAWFKLYPVDNLGIVGTPSDPVSVVIQGITAPDVAAGTLTANLVDAGSGFFQKLSIGAPTGPGTPVNRVPAPLTDSAYWGLVISGAVPIDNGWGTNQLVTATPTGLLMSPSATLDARRYLMQDHYPIPESRKIHTRWLSTGVNAFLQVLWWDAAAVFTIVTLTNNQVYEFPVTAVSYTVRATQNLGTAAETLVSASIFEVIGSRVGQQRAELTPSGLRLTNSDGNGYIDLTTNTSQYFSIQKETSTGIYDSVMAIDSTGNVNANSLSSGTTVEIAGTDLVGAMDARALYEGGIGDLPIMERIGWGRIHRRTFTYPSSINTQFRSIASDYFTAIEGREYEFVVNIGKVEYSNPTDQNLRMELLVSPQPISVTDGSNTYVLTQFLIQNQNQMLPIPTMRAEMKCIATVSDQWSEIPPGTVYWMLRLHFANPITGGPAISQAFDTGNRMISIRDIGPVGGTPSATNWATSGTQAAKTSRRVDTFNATWSATWLPGNSKVVGTTQHQNAKTLYTGTGNTTGIRSSAVGFPALGLSGRTILKAEVYLKNRLATDKTSNHCYLGTASSTTEPATPPTRSNTTSTTFQLGQGKWVTLPTSAHAGLAAGTIRAVTVGYVDDAFCYGYFDGFGQSDPPKLRITSEE